MSVVSSLVADIRLQTVCTAAAKDEAQARYMDSEGPLSAADHNRLNSCCRSRLVNGFRCFDLMIYGDVEVLFAKRVVNVLLTEK